LVRPPATKGKEVGLYEEIMASADPAPDASESGEPLLVFSFINLFPVVLPNGDDWVLDLSGLVTLAPSKRAGEVLLDGKRCEMTADGRAKLRLKLAALLGRPAAD
jgi:hypothetical protein